MVGLVVGLLAFEFLLVPVLQLELVVASGYILASHVRLLLVAALPPEWSTSRKRI